MYACVMMWARMRCVCSLVWVYDACQFVVLSISGIGALASRAVHQQMVLRLPHLPGVCCLRHRNAALLHDALDAVHAQCDSLSTYCANAWQVQ